MTGLLQPGAIARREWLRIVLGASVAASGWKAARAEEPAVVVNIDNFTFSPAAVTVKPGTIVTWTNRDDIPHVVVVQALKLRSKVLDTAESFTHRFERPGSFDYFCALHPYMKGKVIVVA